jgi:catechol 2,3-dioxygenase-like lactoylglutathione lyase family enzyme
MPIRFDHMLVPATDKIRSAAFLAEILGLAEPVPEGFFRSVKLAEGVTLAFAEPGVEFPPLHVAFLITEEDFDGVLARVRERGITYWPDPRQSAENEINTNDGGRGLYFDDPDGHHFEVITRPYGG